MSFLLASLALAAPSIESATPKFGIDLATITSVLPGAPGLLPGSPVGPNGIINGDLLEDGDWPETGAMLALIDIPYGGISIEVVAPICSSTLIAPDVILIAAHCIDGDVLQQGLPAGAEVLEFAFDQRADLAAYQFGTPYDNSVVVGIEGIKHPNFDLSNFYDNLGVAQNDDIALLFLEEPLLDVPLGYLPTEEETEQLVEGNEVAIVGWGQRSQDSPVAGVKYGGYSVLSELGTHEFQVGADVSDVRKCHGDSGGPTFMDVNSESTAPYRVIGVTSHSYDLTDCRIRGGVDTRVDAYLDWIDQTMRDGCDDGVRSWCEWEGIIPPPDADGYEAWEENPNDLAALGDDDDDDDGGEEKSGACNSGGAPIGWLFPGVAMMMLRRRK